MESSVFVLFLFYTAVASFSQGNDSSGAVCYLFDHERMLVCDFDGGSYENPVGYLEANTTSIVLRNSSSLHFYPETHQEEPYEKLITYQLTDISVLEMEPKALAHLHNLKSAHISNSNWTVLRNQTFYNLTKMVGIVLANVGIKQVQEHAFQGLTRLVSLEISNNPLTELPVGVFKDLGNLTTLLLHYNQLESIEDGVLEGLKSLKTLDLSHNKLTVLKMSDINKMANLTQLLLGHNRITQTDGCFQGRNLATIHLQNNKLRQIKNDLFQGAILLRGIDISGNELTQLSVEPFKNLKFFAYLNVQGNNIKDTSEVKELMAFVAYKWRAACVFLRYFIM